MCTGSRVSPSRAPDSESEIDRWVNLVVTESRFLELCEQWRTDDNQHTQTSDDLQRSIDCLRETLEPYAPVLDPADLKLYEELLNVRHTDELKCSLYNCFHLICRVRGPAMAILRVRQLTRWGRKGGKAPCRTA